MWSSIANVLMGVGGSVLGHFGKQDEIDRRQEGIGQLNAMNQSWYNRRYNEDATQRVDTQRLLSKTEDFIRNRNKAAKGRQAVMGGTEESVAAEKERNNQIVSDITSQIAASNERRKDAIEQQYMKRKNALWDEYYDLEGSRPSAYDMAGGILGAVGNGIGNSGLGNIKSK